MKFATLVSLQTVDVSLVHDAWRWFHLCLVCTEMSVLWGNIIQHTHKGNATGYQHMTNIRTFCTKGKCHYLNLINNALTSKNKSINTHFHSVLGLMTSFLQSMPAGWTFFAVYSLRAHPQVPQEAHGILWISIHFPALQKHPHYYPQYVYTRFYYQVNIVLYFS